MRRLAALALLGLVAACATPAAQATDAPAAAVPVGDADPATIVRRAYELEQAHLGDPRTNPAPWTKPLREELFTRRFAALWLRDEDAAQGEVGKIDFDPFIDAQDFDDRIFAALTIDVASRSGERADVRVRFTNTGTATELHLDVVREGGAWRIDDIRSGDRSVAALLR